MTFTPFRYAIAFEWTRIRTLRSTWILATLSVIAAALAAGGTAAADFDGSQRAWMDVVANGSDFVMLFMGLLGVLAFGHEYRYQLIQPTLAALPGRKTVLAAKIVVVSLLSSVMSAVALGVAWSAGRLAAGGKADSVDLTTGPTERIMLGFVLLAVLWCIVGLALSGLFRNIPVAVGLLVAVPLMVEPLLLVLLHIEALDSIAAVGKYLPFAAGAQLTLWDPTVVDPTTPAAFRSDLSAGAGGLTFAVAAAALTAFVGVLFERRDA